MKRAPSSASLGPTDRDKLDDWFTGVRNLETRLAMNEGWIHKPKPKVDMPMPVQYSAQNYLESQRIMHQIIHLALQTDSTRFITLHMDPKGGVLPIEGVEEGHHTLSHHGRDDDKIKQLALIEMAIIKEWGDFLRRLKQTEENGLSMLDSTMVFLTSNLGNASSHNNKNMPVLFAGGGFKHGQHLAFDPNDNYALPNLYLSALHRLNLDFDKFATSTGEMNGLEMV